MTETLDAFSDQNQSQNTNGHTKRTRRNHNKQRVQVPKVDPTQLSALNDALLKAQVPLRYGNTVNLVFGLKDTITKKRAEGMTWAQIASVINDFLGTRIKPMTLQRAYTIVLNLEKKNEGEASEQS